MVSKETNIKALHKQATDARNSGQIEKAVQLYGKVAQQAQDIDDVELEADAYHMAGVSCKEGVQEVDDEYFRKAFKFYDKALGAARKSENKVREGAILRDMAITYTYAKNWNEALERFNESIAALEKESDPAALGITYEKRGLTKLAMGRYKEAEKDMLLGLEKIKEGRHWFFEGTTLMDLARLKVKTGALDEGIKLTNQAMKIFKEHYDEEPHPRRLAQVHGILWQAYLRKGREEVAEGYKEKYEEFLKHLAPDAVPIVREETEMLSS